MWTGAAPLTGGHDCNGARCRKRACLHRLQRHQCSTGGVPALDEAVSPSGTGRQIKAIQGYGCDAKESNCFLRLESARPTTPACDSGPGAGTAVIVRSATDQRAILRDFLGSPDIWIRRPEQQGLASALEVRRGKAALLSG
jgi:hypothetical protein